VARSDAQVVEEVCVAVCPEMSARMLMQKSQSPARLLHPMSQRETKSLGQ
jgi:hypothetical protein